MIITTSCCIDFTLLKQFGNFSIIHIFFQVKEMKFPPLKIKTEYKLNKLLILFMGTSKNAIFLSNILQ